jgi:protein phosphatase
MASGSGYQVHAFALSDVGRVRRVNEDSLCVANLSEAVGIEHSGIIQFDSGPQGGLFAVADGMGGAAAGETASRLCLQTVYEEVSTAVRGRHGTDPASIERMLAAAVGVANRRIYEAGAGNEELAGMGTTLTAALELRGNLVIGQVGDSRAYLIRENEIRQLTRDQSLVAQRVSNGELTEEEARRHPQRNILLQALGVRPAVEVSLKTTIVHPDDLLLLCSDGLHSQLTSDEILDIVLSSEHARDACRDLVDLANDRGGPDNITVVLVRFAASADGY